MYVTELSDSTKETYEEFVSRIRGNEMRSEGKILHYVSNGKTYQLEYGGNFEIDGIVQGLEFKRFDCIYASAERMPDVIEIEFEGRVVSIKNTTPVKDMTF